jgi:hypothetical protein
MIEDAESLDPMDCGYVLIRRRRVTSDIGVSFVSAHDEFSILLSKRRFSQLSIANGPAPPSTSPAMQAR